MNHIPEIYISYAWEKQDDGTNWPILLKNLHKVLIEKGYQVNIDVNNIKYKDNIKSFMEELGKGKYIISIISEKYMKSKNCMYEVLQMLKYPNYRDRIFPILTSDAKVYQTEKIIEYLKYWDSKINNLNNEAKSLSNIAYAGPIFEDIEIMSEIHRALAKFGNQIGNMNVLTPEMHQETNFAQLIESIEKKNEIDKNTISLKIENEKLKEKISNLKKELEDVQEKYAKAILSKSKKTVRESIETEKSIPRSSKKTKTSKQSILMFNDFLSFNNDSHIEEVFKKFGKPTSEDKDPRYNFNTVYFDDGIIEISYYKKSKKIMSIAIETDLDKIDSTLRVLKKYTDDNKVHFLGKSKDEIINTFGDADSVYSDNYAYQLDDFYLNFICYDHNDFMCDRIELQF